jgi:hypothetical protein
MAVKKMTQTLPEASPISAADAQAAAGMALGQMASTPSGPQVKNKQEINQEFLSGINKGRKDKYTNIQDYLTNNGKFSKESKQYKNRLAKVENFRGTAQRENIVISGTLIERAREIYGSTADLYNIPELKSIFEQAFINDWDIDELLRQIDNTDWAKSRTDAQERFDVLKTTDPTQAAAQVEQYIPVVRRNLTQKNLTLSEEQIKSIAEKGARNGWNGNQWEEYTASEAVAFINAGQPQTPQPGGEVAQPVSQVGATDLRKIAKQFGVKVSDQVLNGWVSDIVTNKRNQDQFTEYVRASAQTMFPSLSDRLKTNTFDEIVSPYKQMYSEVLETPEDNIDLTNPTFSNLFTAGDPNKPRMMTSTEWVTFLRKRPEWQNTQNAYSEYAQAASTLNKIFGGTR